MRAHADKRQEHRHNLLIVYVILAIPGLSYTTTSAMTTLKSNNSKITPVRYIYIPKRSEKHQIRVICTLLCGRHVAASRLEQQLLSEVVSTPAAPFDIAA